ncbi:MAG: hypothetical protein QOC94_1623 [Actinoplanes sp.]|nr:hypothetical protein [Actinoplanes sp.]
MPRVLSNRHVGVSLLVLTLAVAAGVAYPGDRPPIAASAPRAAAAPSATTHTPVPAAAPAPHGLPVVDYAGAPPGLPDDPDPRSTVAVTEGVHPASRRVLYDAPGGVPRAYLPPFINGVPVTVPIVARRPGWVAVLVPSVNRRMGWLTTTGWTLRSLPDQLVVRLRAHELTWLRDGVRRTSWTVATGSPATPTPVGRTFVLGRAPGAGAAYGGLDVLALGSVPENRDSLPASLRGAHTGIHSWYSTSSFGRSVSNGCIRVPRDGQRTLLDHLTPGTTLTVLD